MKKIVPVPPGRSIGSAYLTPGVISIIIMALISFRFHLRLETAINELYRTYSINYSNGSRLYIEEKKVLIEGAMMPKIEEVFGNSFIGFWFLMIAVIATIVLNYMYFIGETRPIYLMKRLPDRSEMHRMCLIGPLLMLFLGIVIMLAIAYVDYQMYFLKPPAECIPKIEIDSIIGFLWGTMT